jgi:hypothetical protein
MKSKARPVQGYLCKGHVLAGHACVYLGALWKGVMHRDWLSRDVSVSVICANCTVLSSLCGDNDAEPRAHLV